MCIRDRGRIIKHLDAKPRLELEVVRIAWPLVPSDSWTGLSRVEALARGTEICSKSLQLAALGLHEPRNIRKSGKSENVSEARAGPMERARAISSKFWQPLAESLNPGKPYLAIR